ncbi:outer spore coat protein CotE [Anaeromicrobium sediminis]|uniref:Outer spore coat protein CotE n=1 Tax=Anaeromicrobium sediminis TaxID=1478221 RepID=A0A267M9V4_9FIRM|nr:outer spore coat protein CotE [Anaeromicrobium sediminis]PAB56354.1 hypothetical protein CCE28_20885 [Anaeromicrobium sediminis]
MNDKNNYKSKMTTIITNAVCGRATQTCQTTIFICSENNVEPTQVLGCTITNAKIRGSKFEDSSDKDINIRIDGEFEIHVWYETTGDTAVSKNNGKFSEVISIESLEEAKEYHNRSISAWISKNPVSLGTMIVNKAGVPMISIQVEYELGVEVVGETGINILSYKLDDKEKDAEISLDSVSKEEFNFDDINYDDVD